MNTLLNQFVTLEVPLAISLAASDLQPFEFDGYASTFGTVNSYGYGIDSGAFTKTLKENPNPVLLWQHDELIGGIITATEDKKGLQIRGRLVPEVDRAKTAHALMKADVLRGLSIGFFPVNSRYDQAKKADFLTEVMLREVSLVTFASDPKAKVGRVLSAISALSLRDTEMSREEIQDTIARLQALLAQQQPDSSTADAMEPQTAARLCGLLAQLRTTFQGG